MWCVDEKVCARLRRRRSITERHHRFSRHRATLQEEAETWHQNCSHNHHHHHHYHYHHRHYHNMRFLTRLLLNIFSTVKQISQNISPNNVPPNSDLLQQKSLTPSDYKISCQIRLKVKEGHYNYHSSAYCEYRTDDRLLRRHKSRVCSPLLLLLTQFLWIVPYLFFANYLERSLLPFRLMCYIDPDLLSVQRSLRMDPQHCIRHFFMNRDQPSPECSLNRPLNTLLYPKRVLDAFPKDGRTGINESLHGNVRRVLVVRNAPRHNSYREYIRDTWKRDVEPEIPVVFVSGRDSYDLQKESEFFDDILQFDFEDSYQNLTMKMMSIYKFFIENTNVEQIVVINDDTIVNATGLRQIFYRQQATDAEYYDAYDYEDVVHQSKLRMAMANNGLPLYLIGKVSRGYPRLFFPWLPWYVSSHIYPHKCYPPFVQGSSFVISRAAAARILERICDFPSIHLDDVMMGIITNCLNVRNVHHEGFDRHLLDEFIVYHYQFSRHSADKMRELYAEVKHRL